MAKRGQITLFIILGILLILASVVWYLAPGYEEGILLQVDAVQASRSVSSQLDSCVNTRAEELLGLFGIEGGDLVIVQWSPVYAELPVKNVYRKGVNNLGTRTDWETVLSSAFEEAVEECASALVPLPGTKLELGGSHASVHVNDESTGFSYTPAVTVITESARTVLPDAGFELPVRLGRIHDKVDVIINELVKDPETIPYTTLLEAGFTITLLKNESSFLYTLEDPLSVFQGQSYKFIWGALYGNETPEEHKRPEILNGFETLKTPVNKQFSYKVQAKGKTPLKYYDNTDIFQIDENTGIISFTPTPDQLGMHEIEIAVIDQNGGDMSARYLLLIVP